MVFIQVGRQKRQQHDADGEDRQRENKGFARDAPAVKVFGELSERFHHSPLSSSLAARRWPDGKQPGILAGKRGVKVIIFLI
jgi:hypothetical protein